MLSFNTSVRTPSLHPTLMFQLRQGHAILHRHNLTFIIYTCCSQNDSNGFKLGILQIDLLSALEEMRKKIKEIDQEFTMKAHLKWSDDDKDETTGPELNIQLKGEAEEINVGIDAVITLYPKDLSDYLALKE